MSQPSTTTTTEPKMDCFAAITLADQHLTACKQAEVETCDSYNQLPRLVVLNDTKRAELWRLYDMARRDVVDAEETLIQANRECKRQLAKNDETKDALL